MKVLKILLIVLGAIALFIGCQKEFSLESLPRVSATGTLKNDTGACMPITVYGSYAVDDTLTDSNYVVVQVNFTQAGSYTIVTESANGFYFQDSGYAVKTGVQSITLKGVGRPVAQEITNFSVAFDTSVCTFSVSVAPGVPKAVYTLAGSPNTCANATVTGSFEVGKRLDTTNKVSVSVDVTTPGRFSMTTGTVNGMTFSFPRGEFITTGPQVVVLEGSGTPVEEGTTTFPITADGTSCSFTVTVGSMGTPGLDSAWQFTQGENFYHGFIDTALTYTDSSLNNATILSFWGSSYPGTDTLFQMDLLLPGTTVQPGIYNTSQANADFFLYNRDSTIYFESDTTITPPVNLEINITSYDPATKIVRGFFSGTTRNSSGENVTITGGKIYAKVD